MAGLIVAALIVNESPDASPNTVFPPIFNDPVTSSPACASTLPVTSNVPPTSPPAILPVKSKDVLPPVFNHPLFHLNLGLHFPL